MLSAEEFSHLGESLVLGGSVKALWQNRRVSCLDGGKIFPGSGTAAATAAWTTAYEKDLAGRAKQLSLSVTSPGRKYPGNPANSARENGKDSEDGFLTRGRLDINMEAKSK